MISRSATNLFVGIEGGVLPGDSIKFKIDWNYTISELRPIRTGNYGDNRFFVAYWYPQIAVYDDVDGWDKIDYRGAVEYYNDFNDFDVTIMTTDGFLVWATGTLQNMEEIYDKKVAKKYKEALESDEIVSIYSTDDCRNDKVLNNKRNSWNFTATEVPDFSIRSNRPCKLGGFLIGGRCINRPSCSGRCSLWRQFEDIYAISSGSAKCCKIHV